MTTAIDKELKLGEESLLWRIVYAPKRLQKEKIEEVNISAIVLRAKNTEMKMRVAAIIILALAKISSKQSKKIIEDCKKFLFAMSGKIKAVRAETKKPRSFSSKQEEIADLNSSVFEIDDVEMQPLSDFNIEGMNDLETSKYTDLQQSNYMDLEISKMFPEIETVRDSTLLSDSSLPQPENIFKRRKIIEDKITEISIAEFKKQQRQTSDTLLQYKFGSRNEDFNQELFIHPSILNMIKKEIEAAKASADNSEIERFSGNGSDPIDAGFDFDGSNPQVDGLIEETSNQSDSFCRINFEELDSEFQFEKFIEGTSAANKAGSFFELLSMASKKEIEVFQIVEYGSLMCKKIIQ